MKQIEFGAPGVLSAYADAFDLLVGAFGVSAFETHGIILSEPEPAWLGRLFPGRTIDPATARRLFLDMVAGRGVLCVLVGNPALRLETSWDGAVFADLPTDRADVLTGLRSIGMRVEDAGPEPYVEDDRGATAADDAFWAAVRSHPGELAIQECWANGAFGKRWFRPGPHDLDTVRTRVRPRSTVAVYAGLPFHQAPRERLTDAVSVMGRELDDIVVFASDAGVELSPARNFPSGIADVPRGDLPESAELGFFFTPEDEAAMQAVVPDPDGTVRAPLTW